MIYQKQSITYWCSEKDLKATDQLSLEAFFTLKDLSIYESYSRENFELIYAQWNDQRERGIRIKSLFHTCWGNSNDATEYKKEQWTELQSLLRKEGVDV